MDKVKMKSRLAQATRFYQKKIFFQQLLDCWIRSNEDVYMEHPTVRM